MAVPRCSPVMMHAQTAGAGADAHDARDGAHGVELLEARLVRVFALGDAKHEPACLRAASSALIEAGRPTPSGTVSPGKTTVSRRAMTGSCCRSMAANLTSRSVPTRPCALYWAAPRRSTTDDANVVAAFRSFHAEGRNALTAQIERLRPPVGHDSEAARTVAAIIEDVRKHGDEAVVRYMRKWTDPGFDERASACTKPSSTRPSASLDPGAARRAARQRSTTCACTSRT